ncbi:MAG: methyl-accepting chemotaxis protein [Reichenbachiella sp.]
MNKIYSLCLLSIIWIGTHSSFAQSSTLIFDNYGPDQGLSQSNVTVILEDNSGFMWVGTEDGLNIFDGYSFTTFRADPDDSLSISDNWIRSIVQDQEGQIWIGTNNGLNRYDRVTNSFTRYMADASSSTALPQESATNLFIDSTGNFWISTSGGLSRYRNESDDFITIKNDFNNPTGFAQELVGDIVEDKNGKLWIGGNNGLSMTDDFGKSFTNYKQDPGSTSSKNIHSNDIQSLFIDTQDRLWIGYLEDGVDVMDLGTGEVTQYAHKAGDPNSISNNYVQEVVENENGEIYIATDGGLNLFLGDGTFKHYGNSANDEFSLTSSIIMCAIFDSHNDLWLGSRLGGLFIYDEDKYGFGLIQSNPSIPNSLISNKTSGFAEDANGNLAVATDGGGINFYNKETNSFVNMRHEPGNTNSISNNKVLALEYDRNGGLWIGMWAGGVNYYNPKTGIVKRYQSEKGNPNALQTNNIFDIHEDHKGVIWIGTWSAGLCRYNPDTDDFTNFFNDLDKDNDIYCKGINQIVEDQEGNLWIADEVAGVVVFNQDKQFTKQYQKGEAEGDLLGSNIFTILVDSKNNIWVGTNTGGLALLDKKTDKFRVFREKHGLPSDAVVGLLEDNQGSIWASTNNGLSRINPSDFSFRNYDKADGLQGNEFMPRNRLKLSTGELLFGGNGGYNRFDPSALRENKRKPAVYITTFKLANQSEEDTQSMLSNKNITFLDELVLNYDQNFFSLEYVGLSFRHSEKNQYQYIMEGLQERWVDAGTQRKVSFTGIAPGDYVFKVRASNNNGLWTDMPATLKITIVPPYWQTWWFRAILLIAVIASVAGLYKWRMRQVQLDKAILEEKVREATDQVSNQNAKLQEQSERLNSAIEETNQVVMEAIESGNFNARIETESKTGAWRDLSNSVNNLFDSVSKPFNSINTIVNHLAEGDLTKRYSEEAKGDILKLSTNLNKAMDNMAELLGTITLHTAHIEESTKDMLVTSVEMNVSTGEIASSISEISEGAQAQVMKIDDSSNLIEGILSASNQMGEQAESINSVAQMGVAKSGDGQELIGEVDSSMKEILSFSHETNQSIGELTQKSQDISSVLRIIKEIAAQTNLLALNAAIEAAQAGDAGRGFSVVAEEIRKLAEDSKKSAGEIESLILEVQNGTNSTAKLVKVMSENIKKCEESTTQSMSTFESITKYYDDALQRSEQILTATKQQTNDIDNVLGIINGVVVIAEETAAATEETASSSEELSVGMVNYAEKTKQVSQITKDLMEQVARFKLA